LQRNSPRSEIGEQSLSTGIARVGERGRCRPVPGHRSLAGVAARRRVRYAAGAAVAASLALAEGIEIHCNSKSQVHMTPPVNRTGSVGTSKRAPASSAITPAAAHPATRSSSRAHTPAIMAGLKRLAPFNYARSRRDRQTPGIRSPCCGRAASGHATAAPPRSVMNSRRFIRLLRLFGPAMSVRSSDRALSRFSY
jgi:hypothetical protein